MRPQPQGAQLGAVESEAETLLVVAPPGCGKTEVLAMRAEWLLRNGAVSSGRRLLAVTFTNRARDNLRHRLTSQLGERTLRSSVTVANFHELSARILDAHYRLVGLEPGYQFPKPAWARKTLNDITKDTGRQRHALNVLGRLKHQALSDDEIIARLEEDDEQDALRFEARRAEENWLDYSDMPRYAQLILRNDRAAKVFQSHFHAVLVDEFQDLSTQQYELVQRLCARSSTFVGDPYQGIFSWAGAEPSAVFDDLLTRADQTIELDVSFRSSPAVLEVVNAIAVPLGSAALSAAEPESWAHGGHAYAARYATDVAEADGIVSLTDYLARKYPDDTIGVICRAVYRRGAVERAYERAKSTPHFWDISLDTPRIARLLKLHARHVDEGLSFAEQIEDLRFRVCSSLAQQDIDTAKEVDEGCDQLREHEDTGLSVRQLVARLRDHTVVSAISPGVHVLNAHVGKGQQFDWVIVMGMEEGHIPSYYSKTDADYLEDRRVLLVMASRARKGIFITRAVNTKNKYGTSFRQEPSRWWAAIEEGCKEMPAAFAKLMKV
ncbi:MAG: UvrD-helicase domain-containing protein [Actinomycetota bacterium]